MRTTLAIDDDLLAKLKEIGRKRRIPLRQVVDETLRRGLTSQERRRAHREPFRVLPFESAFRPGIDPLRLNQLVDDLEAVR